MELDKSRGHYLSSHERWGADTVTVACEGHTPGPLLEHTLSGPAPRQTAPAGPSAWQSPLHPRARHMHVLLQERGKSAEGFSRFQVCTEAISGLSPTLLVPNYPLKNRTYF